MNICMKFFFLCTGVFCIASEANNHDIVSRFILSIGGGFLALFVILNEDKS